MATYAAERVATRARRPAGSAGVPIVAAKITAPGVPDWVVPRPRITELIAAGHAVVPADCCQRPGGRGQDDGPGVVGGGPARDGCLGRRG